MAFPILILAVLFLLAAPPVGFAFLILFFVALHAEMKNRQALEEADRIYEMQQQGLIDKSTAIVEAAKVTGSGLFYLIFVGIAFFAVLLISFSAISNGVIEVNSIPNLPKVERPSNSW